jgi:hypothetical protein
MLLIVRFIIMLHSFLDLMVLVDQLLFDTINILKYLVHLLETQAVILVQRFQSDQMGRAFIDDDLFLYWIIKAWRMSTQFVNTGACWIVNFLNVAVISSSDSIHCPVFIRRVMCC